MATYEEMELLWDETRNGVPFSSLLNHSIRFWWIGNCGHSWETNITNKKLFGCPVCAGKLIQPGVNDLASHYPDVAAQWHPTKNNKIPTEIACRSSNKAWWVCEKGHEWEAKILHRANGSGCPVCSNFKLLTGYNDLTTTHPDIAAQWHPTKNDKLAPEQIKSSTNKKVWWQCEKGHEWEAVIRNRTQSGTGCHECSGYGKSLNNSNTELDFPYLSQQWSEKNLGKLSDHVSNSLEEVWWQCEKPGHEWLQSIKDRVTAKSKCPVCSGHKLIINVNDLAFNYPEVAAQWHPTKNGELTAEQVTLTSGKKVWWLSKDCGHEWEAVIANRTVSGSGCKYCKFVKSSLTRRKPKRGLTDLASQYPEIAKEWHPTKNGELTAEQVNRGSNIRVWWQCEKGHEWYSGLNSRTHYQTKCPRCAATAFSSKSEKEIFDYVSSLLPSAVANSRNVLKNKNELDIYVPEKNIAIEFNGLYWHDENHKPKFYHYDKWVACKEQGIQLIQIWEDEWDRNPELVKRMLAYKLGLNIGLKIYARETKVVTLTTGQADKFLTENHVQGTVAGGIRLGLVEKRNPESIVAVMVLKTESGSEGKMLNLLRFATSQQVTGGFTKLLKHVTQTYAPESIISFSDNCVSDGGLYRGNGFTAVKELAPDYRYVVKGERVHKFLYRLKRFRNDPELQFEEGLTERELALLNNLPRIWDAGKTKWVNSSSV